MLIFLRIHCVALNRLSLLMGDSPISLGVSMKSEAVSYTHLTLPTILLV